MAGIMISVGSNGLRGVVLCGLMLGCAAPLSEEECLALETPSQFCPAYVSEEPCSEELDRAELADGTPAYCCRTVSRECGPSTP